MIINAVAKDEIFVPPIANTMMKPSGGLANDKDEEFSVMEIVMKPFRAHGPYNWPACHDSEKDENMEEVNVIFGSATILPSPCTSCPTWL